jgi:hypothetical protein
LLLVSRPMTVAGSEGNERGEGELRPKKDTSKEEAGLSLWWSLLNSSVDDLANTPAQNPPEKSIAERIDDEKLEELKDARNYRKSIVTFTLITVGGLVLAATGFMIAYMVSQWDEIAAGVMIAYFSSVVVESIGILYVISRYLFPHSGPTRAGASDDE